MIKNYVYVLEHFRLNFNGDETLKMVSGTVTNSFGLS